MVKEKTDEWQRKVPQLDRIEYLLLRRDLEENSLTLKDVVGEILFLAKWTVLLAILSVLFIVAFDDYSLLVTSNKLTILLWSVILPIVFIIVYIFTTIIYYRRRKVLRERFKIK